ncbi:sulfotransferase [Alphaproteobacteria bacterium]|nr:sulfotransferase [Alphaproteobacteria bacterium]
MNNYSWLQQKLHQIALSFQFMREVTFDIESSTISKEQSTDNNVFVSGLSRSGTTILMNALYKSDEFASLSYHDMPFVLAPNLWSKLSFSKKNIDFIERAHGDGIKVSSESPEAFEEVFWMTFNENDEDTQKKFKTYVQLINKKYDKQRYLSKNNQNIRRLLLISNTFPHSKILISYRHPIQHAYSLLFQHKKFIEVSKKDKFISNYMRWIGHTEFGPNYIPIHNKNLNFKNDLDINHWLEQWYLTYNNCFKSLIDKSNVYFICYEQLCSSKEYWSDILKKLAIKETYDFEFRVSQKDIPLEIENGISNKASSLYSELSNIEVI